MQNPSIAFVLDQPEDKVHRPGDELTGRVELRGLDRLQVRELRVEFRGISRITIPSRLPWSVPSETTARSDEATVNFLSQRRVFDRGALLFDDVAGDVGRLSAVVSFAFPSGGPTGSGAASSRTASADGPLPPSLRCFGQPFDCSVEYALEAELELASAERWRGAKTCTARRVLDFEPVEEEPVGPPPPPPPQTLVTFESSFALAPLPHRLDVRTDGPLSFRDKFNSFIYRNRQTPTSFSIVVRVPSRLVRREPLPLLVTLRLDNATPAASQRRFQVQGVTLAMEMNTTVQGPGNKTLRHTDKIVLFEDRTLDVALPANTEVDLWPKVSSLAAPELPPPTFASHGITRDYGSEVVISVGCGNEEFQVKASVPSLVVLPSAALDMPGLPAEEEPPSYETVVGSSSVTGGAAPPYSPPPESSADRGYGSDTSFDKVKCDFEGRGRVFEFVRGEKKYWKERGMANMTLQWDRCGMPMLLAKYVKTGQVCVDHHSESPMRVSLRMGKVEYDVTGSLVWFSKSRPR
ncbi:Ran GTPase binding protein Sbp1 [Purpureocillium takamizusanense]|uniref:Ran GTPase binding protein Sbp1 n=1 Tax=Purpureocillium takamizusanense TaxID=2060973 RepID=A0A9Q8Q5D8_9HYPO|nr:Ran GTPase binding protein Sbp1 [Purpureocillium takamizusanense]UNI14034.1 Ran GTPase binding protein Sbp1 [Purpureocillium takamizusanense]